MDRKDVRKLFLGDPISGLGRAALLLLAGEDVGSGRLFVEQFLFFPDGPDALFERQIIRYHRDEVTVVGVTIDVEFLIETARQMAVARLQRYVDEDLRTDRERVVCSLTEESKPYEALVRWALFTNTRQQLEKVRQQSALWRPILDELTFLATIDGSV